MLNHPVPKLEEPSLAADNLFCQDPNCKYCRQIREEEADPKPKKVERTHGD